MDYERKPKLPKNAFDSEYFTEYLREVRFLTEKGIKYTFVKKTPEYGVSQYKYTKTPALFAALVEFYSMIEAERNFKRKEKTEVKEPSISPEQIKQAQEILEKAVQQNIVFTPGAAADELKVEKDDTL